MGTVIPPPPPAPGAGPSQAQTDFARLALAAGARSDGHWFYWIAALSAINSLAALSGTNWRFLISLGITQVVDAVGKDLSGVGKIAALVVDFFMLGIFVVLGVFAAKLQKWAFITGMVLFALDAALELLVQDWIGLAFHAYALYFLFRGLKRVRMLEALTPPDFSKPIG